MAAYDHASTTAREAKSGYQSLKRENREQIDKDVWLRENPEVDTEWHFFPSKTSGILGPNGPLLDYLQKNKIPYYVWPPT